MHSSSNKNFGVRRSLEKLYGFSIDTVNMYFGDIQSRLDLCISLLQPKVNKAKCADIISFDMTQSEC